MQADKFISRLVATDHAQARYPGSSINHRASGAARAVSLNPPTSGKAATIGMAIGSGAGPVPRPIRGGTLAAAGLQHTQETRERISRTIQTAAEEDPTEIRRADRRRMRESG